MNKLRKEERKQVLTFTPVYDLQESFLLGYLGDLSMTGALLVSERSIDTNRHIVLAIEFREASEIPAATRMIIPARVVWCELEGHETYYATGLEFPKVSEQNKKIIQTMLKKYQINRKMPV